MRSLYKNLHVSPSPFHIQRCPHFPHLPPFRASSSSPSLAIHPFTLIFTQVSPLLIKPHARQGCPARGNCWHDLSKGPSTYGAERISSGSQAQAIWLRTRIKWIGLCSSPSHWRYIILQLQVGLTSAMPCRCDYCTCVSKIKYNTVVVIIVEAGKHCELSEIP